VGTGVPSDPSQIPRNPVWTRALHPAGAAVGYPRTTQDARPAYRPAPGGGGPVGPAPAHPTEE